MKPLSGGGGEFSQTNAEYMQSGVSWNMGEM